MSTSTDSTLLSSSLASTETLKLAEVLSLCTFYTPIEDRFERITRLARRALDVPVAAVTAVSFESQWFKSVSGWAIDELPLHDSLCERTIIRKRRVIVPDLTKNLRYSQHPLVTRSPDFRFYAGMPLMNPHGTVVGTFCVMDTQARKFDLSDRRTLEDIAALAQREFLTAELRDAQTELIAKLSAARRQALLDPLTRTWNRRGGALLLETGLELAKRNQDTLAVCVIDVNDFKAVNDTYGHAAGDRALCRVARELLACVRPNDGVCRFGGDEFFVVMVGVSEVEADRIAERARQRVQHARIRVDDDRDVQVSICTGIRFVPRHEATSAAQVLAEADKALYQSKMNRSASGNAVDATPLVKR